MSDRNKTPRPLRAGERNSSPLRLVAGSYGRDSRRQIGQQAYLNWLASVSQTHKITA